MDPDKPARPPPARSLRTKFFQVDFGQSSLTNCLFPTTAAKVRTHADDFKPTHGGRFFNVRNTVTHTHLSHISTITTQDRRQRMSVTQAPFQCARRRSASALKPKSNGRVSLESRQRPRQFHRDRSTKTTPQASQPEDDMTTKTDRDNATASWNVNVTAAATHKTEAPSPQDKDLKKTVTFHDGSVFSHFSSL